MTTRMIAEAGRVLSAANEQKLRNALAAINEVLAQLGDSPATESLRETAARLAEELSYGERERAVRSAIKAASPRQEDYYCYIVDLYDDRVIYEEETPEGTATYQRSYAIDDAGNVTLGDPVKVVRHAVYLPVSETGDVIGEVIRREGSEWVLYTSDGKKVLGRFKTKKEALKRERQIQFFKHREAKIIPEDVEIDLDGYEPTEEEIAAALAALEDDATEEDAEEAARGGGNVQRLVSTFGKWAGGKHTGCVNRLKGKEGIDDPERLCAWLKDRYTGTTKWRGKKKESADPELDDIVTSDVIPLVERAVKDDGTIRIKVIAPGQGSSGFYPEDVLKRDGPKVFRAGTHMFLDHPTRSEEEERPERSLKDLAGVLVSDAWYDANGPAGPGLYAEAKVRSDLAPLLEEIAPHIGVSIRGTGRAATREVDGKPLKVIDAIERAFSVDFVTMPGAGGRVLDLVESARKRRQEATPAMSDTGQHVHVAELEETRRQLDETRQELARLREALILREARDVVMATLAASPLPEPTRKRLAETLAVNPPIKDGALDRDALTTRVREAAQAEAAYLAQIVGTGGIRGMGARTAPSADDAEKQLAEAFTRLLGNEELAKIAVAGRL